jgi:hypothetical protein
MSTAPASALCVSPTVCADNAAQSGGRWRHLIKGHAAAGARAKGRQTEDTGGGGRGVSLAAPRGLFEQNAATLPMLFNTMLAPTLSMGVTQRLLPFIVQKLSVLVCIRSPNRLVKSTKLPTLAAYDAKALTQLIRKRRGEDLIKIISLSCSEAPYRA